MTDDPIAGDPALMWTWTRIVMALVCLLSAMWGLNIGMDDLSP